MSAGAKTFIFILLLPFFAALGHDVYHSYFSSDEKIKQIERLNIEPDNFQMSDVGWLWQEYAPNSMQSARDMIEPEAWSAQLDPFLQMTSMVAALIPFGVGLIYLALAFILGVWPFSRFGATRREKSNDYAVYEHAKEKSFKFKKK